VYIMYIMYIYTMKATTKYEMSLLSKGIKVTKVCKNEIECFKFERDMPAKYNLLFTNIPYIICKRYIA